LTRAGHPRPPRPRLPRKVACVTSDLRRVAQYTTVSARFQPSDSLQAALRCSRSRTGGRGPSSAAFNHPGRFPAPKRPILVGCRRSFIAGRVIASRCRSDFRLSRLVISSSTRRLVGGLFEARARYRDALLVALVLKASGREIEAAQAIRAAAPHAHPNRRIVALADAILGLDGRLIAAREAMEPAEPMMHGPLVRLPLLSSRAS
jgi:hypothetical protein